MTRRENKFRSRGQNALKGKFSSGIEGALASTLNRDFNWKQLSEMILCNFFMCSKFIWVTLIQKQQKYIKKETWILGVGAALYYDLKYNR